MAYKITYEGKGTFRMVLAKVKFELSNHLIELLAGGKSCRKNVLCLRHANSISVVK